MSVSAQVHKSTPAPSHAPQTAPSGTAPVQRKELSGLDYAAQVQMLAPGPDGGPRGDVHTQAAEGLSGGGGTLPHLDRIQKSFGGHDVSDVQAHQGPEAARAARGMGAQAYASGDKVALGDDAKDLHTVAHEAAHVVQQRQGVSLSGGVGDKGDRYEQHADAVADAVVQGRSAEGLLGAPGRGGGGRAVQKAVQKKAADPNQGLSDGKTSFEDFNGGAASPVAKGKAGLEQSKENNMTLAEQAKSINTQTARSEKEMLAAIAAGGMPRFVARVDEKANFSKFGTFGNPTREFVFATEPADLRGCKPGAALVKVGWTKAWLGGKIGKEIGVCILDTQKAISTPSGDKKVEVGKMEWPQLIAKAMGDADFFREAQGKGVVDKTELGEILEALSKTPVKATPRYKDPAKALEVRKLLDKAYGANELYTGMGATMNTEGQLGAREVMVQNNGTGLKLTPANHVIESLGVLTQGEYDAMPG